MNMPMLMVVTRATVARLLITHDAQHARTSRLQHINNNQLSATANHSQTPCLRGAACMGEHIATPAQLTSGHRPDWQFGAPGAPAR
jgi:hypothetical protein